MPWSRITDEIDEYGAVPGPGERVLGYAAALREGLAQALAADSSVFVMGQGVDDPSGMFGSTRGLREEFGPERVFDTPLAETALTGVAVGAAMGGMRPVYMHNRPDFLLLAMDQLVNHASKWHFMFGGEVNVPVVLWACTGRGWGSAAQHSQALQALFFHIPGLKLAIPSTCRDAKGLLASAISDPNPVLILDHRLNFRNQGPVPERLYTIPFGKAAIRRKGTDVTLLGISHMASEACLAAEELAAEGIDAEVIDPRTLRPLDTETIMESVSRTGRLVVADSAWRTGGVAAEICCQAAELCLDKLKAPPLRVTCPDLPTPAGCTLEKAFYPGKHDIAMAARRTMGKGCAA